MSVSILGYIVSADPFETSAVSEQAAALRYPAQQMGTDVPQTYIVPFSTVETTRSATALAKENGWAIGVASHAVASAFVGSDVTIIICSGRDTTAHPHLSTIHLWADRPSIDGVRDWAAKSSADSAPPPPAGRDDWDSLPFGDHPNSAELGTEWDSIYPYKDADGAVHFSKSCKACRSFPKKWGRIAPFVWKWRNTHGFKLHQLVEAVNVRFGLTTSMETIRKVCLYAAYDPSWAGVSEAASGE